MRTFLTASQSSDFFALLAILDLDVVLHADAAAVAATAHPSVPGLAPVINDHVPVANTFRGRARIEQLVLVSGEWGLVRASGKPRMVVNFAIENGRIIESRMTADAEGIAALELQF